MAPRGNSGGLNAAANDARFRVTAAPAPCRYCGIPTYKGTKAHQACTLLWKARARLEADKAMGQYVGEELCKALGVRT